MDKKGKLFTNAGDVLAFSVIGATLMMGVDLGGARWLTFILYVLFFGTIASPAVSSSRYSCSGMLRLRSRS